MGPETLLIEGLIWCVKNKNKIKVSEDEWIHVENVLANLPLRQSTILSFGYMIISTKTL